MAQARRLCYEITGQTREGPLADKTTHQVLDGLRRAAAEPAGAYLYAARGAAGLFPANTAGKLAAQRCVDEGYLRLLRTEPRSKGVQEIYTVSDKGLAYLLDQGNPRQLLEDLVRALEARETQLGELLTLVRLWQTGMADLRGVTEKLLHAVASPPGLNGKPPSCEETEQESILHCLGQWQAAEDCPLPELYRRVQAREPRLALGQFHDALRVLKEQDRIYLHPWTGPLYAMPEPACALLSGHEVAYYASLR